MDRKSCLLCLLALLCNATGNDVMERAADPVAHLTSVTNGLTNKVTQLTNQVKSLQADLDNKKQQINSLTAQLQQKGRDISILNGTLNRAQTQLHNLDTYCKTQTTSITNRVVTLERSVAFTVRFSQDSVGNLTTTAGRWQYLKFDLVQYQAGGNNYNRSTGIFTAPSTGVYAFFLTIERNDPTQNDCLEATIMRNTAWLATATVCPDGYSSASNMAVSWMVKGDKVFVRTQHSERVFGFTHTTFTGMKLTPH